MSSSRIAYANLRAEMARENLTIMKIAEAIGYSRLTTGNKLANVVPLTLEDAAKIGELFPGRSILYLFSEVLGSELSKD